MVFVDGHVGSMSAEEAAEEVGINGKTVTMDCKVAWPRGDAEPAAI